MRAASTSNELSLDSKVAFLRQPSAYPETCFRVEAIETHMSWVFMTERHAWKLKKPVTYDYLDFSTVAARHFYCKKELRLNRRLAAEIYLDVVPVGIDAANHFRIGEGQPVDWLVKMQRLPLQTMLDYAIRRGTARESDIEALAGFMGRFYATSIRQELDVEACLQRFRHDIARNLDELSTPGFGLPRAQIETACQAHHRFLENHGALLAQRITDGKIVEGHGDLRPEHVCLHPQIAVIDCLEFSRELRIIDPIDELGFLAMECERLGAPRLGQTLLHSYAMETKDRPSDELLAFYQSFRACLRARIAIRHLHEEKFRYSAEWRRRALDYLDLAERHLSSIRH